MNTTTTAYIVKSGFRAENQSRSILGCSALSSVFPGWKPDKDSGCSSQLIIYAKRKGF
jgi:hypothetical protein